MAEYKQAADEAGARGILHPDEARRLKIVAGYRSRLVHFYHEVTPEELCQICTQELDEILALREAFTRWVRENPQSIDQTL